MLSVAKLTSTLVGADMASRSNQDRWICGYDSSKEGSAVARLEKILGGLRNLTMVGDEAWIYVDHKSTHFSTAKDRNGDIFYYFLAKANPGGFKKIGKINPSRING